MVREKPQQFMETAKPQRQPFIEMVKTDEAVAVLGLGSEDGIFLCHLAVPVLLCHSFNSCASSSLECHGILTCERVESAETAPRTWSSRASKYFCNCSKLQ
jgi:hypothetical protein